MDNSHTGFIARYRDGTIIPEKNNFYDSQLKKICATNWHQINKEKLQRLELWWKGYCRAKIDNIHNIKEWIFYHTAIYDSSMHKSVTLSRTIGYIDKSGAYTYTILESNGDLS